MKRINRSIVFVVFLAGCVAPVLAATCYGPDIGTCDQDAQKGNCVGIGGNCDSYDACPCDESCGVGGWWSACSPQTVTRSMVTYLNGTINAAGCCRNGNTPTQSAATCTYTKAFIKGGACSTPFPS